MTPEQDDTLGSAVEAALGAHIDRANAAHRRSIWAAFAMGCAVGALLAITIYTGVTTRCDTFNADGTRASPSCSAMGKANG